jgi:hypothetical protein
MFEPCQFDLAGFTGDRGHFFSMLRHFTLASVLRWVIPAL